MPAIYGRHYLTDHCIYTLNGPKTIINEPRLTTWAGIIYGIWVIVDDALWEHVDELRREQLQLYLGDSPQGILSWYLLATAYRALQRDTPSTHCTMRYPITIPKHQSLSFERLNYHAALPYDLMIEWSWIQRGF